MKPTKNAQAAKAEHNAAAKARVRLLHRALARLDPDAVDKQDRDVIVNCRIAITSRIEDIGSAAGM
jgi:hypothetical protein